MWFDHHHCPSEVLQVLGSLRRSSLEILFAPQPLKEVNSHAYPRRKPPPARLHPISEILIQFLGETRAHPSEKYKLSSGRSQASFRSISVPGKPFHYWMTVTNGKPSFTYGLNLLHFHQNWNLLPYPTHPLPMFLSWPNFTYCISAHQLPLFYFHISHGTLPLWFSLILFPFLWSWLFLFCLWGNFSKSARALEKVVWNIFSAPKAWEREMFSALCTWLWTSQEQESQENT